MKLKALSILTLAACLQIGTLSQAFAAKNSFEVKFAKGEDHAQLNGTIQGYDVDRYHFYAKKGQLLTLEVIDKDEPVQFSLLSTKKAQQSALNPRHQVLPYTGTYLLTVYQTRNDARKAPKDKHFYSINLRINNQSVSPSKAAAKDKNVLTYRCDNGKTLQVGYRRNQAKVNWQGDEQILKFNPQYSQDNTAVFSNDRYMLSVDTVAVNQWQTGKINSWIALGKTAVQDKVLLQECVVSK